MSQKDEWRKEKDDFLDRIKKIENRVEKIGRSHALTRAAYGKLSESLLLFIQANN